MRPFTAVSAAAASVGVLVVTWNGGQESTAVPAPPTAAAPAPTVAAPGHSAPPSSASNGARTTAAPRTSAPGPAPGPPTSPSASPSAAPSSAGARTVTGPSINTRYGAVQVQVALSGTRITNVVALHLTDSNRTSVEISAASAPTLRQEALTAQSAKIDVVSGATYTSTGYQQSLQAALDAAHA